jgi:V/A-type H+-transporting ATPase subunit I
MTMINIIGKIEDVDNIVRDLLETKKVSPTSAIAEIEKNNFLLDVSNENVDRLVDLNFVHFYKRNKRYEEMIVKSKELQEMLDLHFDLEELSKDLEMSEKEISDSLVEIYEQAKTISTMLDALKKEVAYLENFHTNSFKEMSSLKTTIDDLRDMEYFNFKLGILSKEDRHRLKKNYESILAILIHAGSSPEGEVFLVIYPENQDAEIARILRSLNFREIVIPKTYSGTPREILEEIEAKEESLVSEIDRQGHDLEELKHKYEKEIKYLFSQISLISRVDAAKEEIAISDHYFYFSAWMVKTDKEIIQEILRKYDDIFMIFKEETELNTPTNIKSSKPLRRFDKIQQLDESGDPSLLKKDGVSPVQRFGKMLYELNHTSVDLKKKHEDELKAIKQEGQEKIKELEMSLLKMYTDEAEKAYQDALSGADDVIDSSIKDLSYYDKVISDVEQTYIRVKPELINGLWNEILTKEE